MPGARRPGQGGQAFPGLSSAPIHTGPLSHTSPPLPLPAPFWTGPGNQHHFLAPVALPCPWLCSLDLTTAVRHSSPSNKHFTHSLPRPTVTRSQHSTGARRNGVGGGRPWPLPLPAAPRSLISEAKPGGPGPEDNAERRRLEGGRAVTVIKPRRGRPRAPRLAWRGGMGLAGFGSALASPRHSATLRLGAVACDATGAWLALPLPECA